MSISRPIHHVHTVRVETVLSHVAVVEVGSAVLITKEAMAAEEREQDNLDGLRVPGSTRLLVGKVEFKSSGRSESSPAVDAFGFSVGIVKMEHLHG